MKIIKTIRTTASVFAISLAAFAAPPADTSTNLGFSPVAIVPQFAAATAIVTVTSGGSPVVGGTVTVYSANGPCITQRGNAGVQPSLLSGIPNGNGQVVFDLQAAGLTSTPGSLGYIAVYENAGTYKKSAAACLDFTVTPGPPDLDPFCPLGQNATISLTYVTAPGFPLPGSYNWNLVVTVHACKDLTNVTAQGGTNAWGRKVGGNAGTIWTIGSMPAGANATLPVWIDGTINKTACGTVLGLVGSWSATSTSLQFGTQKSAYSGTSTVTVGPSPCLP